MKTCKTCGVEKSFGEYYVYPGGYFAECKTCSCARSRAWNQAADPDRLRSNKLKSKYGISLERYRALLVEQGGCAICGSDDPGGKGVFHVDHDHGCCPGERSCGECVRGLLCHGCNTGIGSLGEDIERLTSATAYLLSRQNVLKATAF